MKISFERPPDPLLIDLEKDKLEKVAQIYFRLTGKRLNPQKLWRWRLKGCRGVKLEAVLLEGVWHTTAKAFAAFVRGQTEAANDACHADVRSTDRDSVTERRLRKAGLLDQSSSAPKVED